MPSMNLKKLWRRKSVSITEYDPTYKVVYLGNVLTGWAKGDGCVEKPLATLWRNYCQSARPDISMKVTICGAGLRAVTQEHGLTEYWSHRVTHCSAHAAYPRVFCWVYRHEGRRLKQELRCHAILCPKQGKAELMATQLKDRLASALHEFRREKTIRQNARLSLVNAIYESSSLPMRKIYLITGSSNYRPPLERSKSAPKLGAIEEMYEEEEEEELLTLMNVIATASTVNSVHRSDPLRIELGRDCNPATTETHRISPVPVPIGNSLLPLANLDDSTECDKLELSCSDPLKASGGDRLELDSCEYLRHSGSHSNPVELNSGDHPLVDDSDDLELKRTDYLRHSGSDRIEFSGNDHFKVNGNNHIELEDINHIGGGDHSGLNGSDLLEVIRSRTGLTFSSPNLLFYPPPPPAGDQTTLALLETFKDNLPPSCRAEESLTSDQPESIAFSSCSSSEGGSEEEVAIPDVISIGDVIITKDHKCSTGPEEEDNISEESGYSEDKEILESVRVQV